MMASQSTICSDDSTDIEIIDLTNETTRLNNTIVIDDSFAPIENGNELTSSPISSTSSSLSLPSLIDKNDTSPSKPKATSSKAAEKRLNKELRENAKKLKQQNKEAERLQKEANRANAANKALENCKTFIHREVLQIIKDPEELSLRTLFDESMLQYQITDHPREDNSITWTLRRTEVADGSCTSKFKDSDWCIVVMHGSEYLKRVLTHKAKPNDSQSIKTHLCNIRKRTQSNLILMVFELASHLKNERMKDAKNYRKTFKDKFEAPRVDSEASNPDDGSNLSAIGITELQELRLMLQIEFNHENPDWKLQVEFLEKTCDVVQSIVKYSLSIAKLEVKQKTIASTGLDWALNMDKEKAVDPTKSGEELTRLWTSQLQQFHQVTLPVAKAIATEYPSPSALLDQYSSLTPSEAESLLSSINVQRNLKRQVGASISRRIHCFMTCDDPDTHLGFG